jgi:hypothetical protein
MIDRGDPPNCWEIWIGNEGYIDSRGMQRWANEAKTFQLIVDCVSLLSG